MDDAIISAGLTGAGRSKAETKADITNHTARAIIGAEADKMAAKTAKLRQARLEREAQLAAEPPVEKPKKKAVARAKAAK